jgi:hypothetical protein
MKEMRVNNIKEFVPMNTSVPWSQQQKKKNAMKRQIMRYSC